jgi:putative ABC transport system permease protein
VAISEGAAHFAQWPVGQRLQIYGSDFRVSGIFQASGTKFSSVWMPIEEARRLFGPGAGYQMAFVQVAGEVAGEEGARCIVPLLESDPRIGERYDVYLEDRFNERYTDLIEKVRNLTVIITGIALLGISFGTYNAANLSATERARELAILRAIGFSPATERAYLVLRVGLQSLLAYALGVLTAAIFVGALQAGEPLETCGVCLPFRLTPANILVGLGLALLLALAGAWFSTGKRARLTVAQVLSQQGNAQGA